VTDFVTYRVAAWDTPLWVLPNRRGGRFNEPGVASTQYLCLHPLTPWAEILRAEKLRDPDDIAQLRPPLWAIRVALADDPAAITFDTAADYGIRPEDLVGDDHGPCRKLAAELRADPAAPKALVVPSAALPGTANLVLLGPYVAIPYLLKPVDPGDLPVSLISESGGCPRSLEALVHYEDSPDPHDGLAAWRNGDELAFEEPDTLHLAA
jgi:RES domain-containing protein